MAAICIGLVVDEWTVGMTPSKVAVVYGTLVGYIMLSIVIILGIVLDIPLDRTLVRTGYLFVQTFLYHRYTYISVSTVN
jgi:hypothetical protein